MAGANKIWAMAKTFTLLLALLHVSSVAAFYLPGSYLKAYRPGSDLRVKANSLTSYETELPYSYYSLPFCEPPGGRKGTAENLGELLAGDRIENSPYGFSMTKNESGIGICSKALSERDVKHFKQRIDDFYQVNLLLDNLPVTRYVRARGENLLFTGYPVGFVSENVYYLYNHLKFKVLIHEYEPSSVVMITDGDDVIATNNPSEDDKKELRYTIVGFEVFPCSFRHDVTVASSENHKPVGEATCDNSMAQVLKEGDTVTWSYDVSFEKSEVRWPSRWDAYLQSDGSRIHWFSILNSLVVILFLAGIVFVIFLRTVRRDLTKYEELDKEAQAQMTEELSGWKLVVGDVFRTPSHAALFCIMVGDGVRITGMAIVTIFFAALGFMSPASRGMLLTGMVFLYLGLGIAAGYVACRLWKTVNSNDAKDWRAMAWRVACFFPGISFLILTLLNFLLWGSKSTGAIPIALFFILLALWFSISVPLTLMGGYLGSKAEPIQYPVRTNQIPREIPRQKYPSWLFVLGTGTLPFGTLFIELFFIMSSIWMGRVYYVFGFLFIVLILLIVVCSEVSVILTYMHLCVEDWQWWWKSFFSSASVALYVFLYSMHYLVFDLGGLSGSVSTLLYIGYSLLMSLAIMLATGTIGFLASFLFVHHLFSSVKID